MVRVQYPHKYLPKQSSGETKGEKQKPFKKQGSQVSSKAGKNRGFFRPEETVSSNFFR